LCYEGGTKELGIAVSAGFVLPSLRLSFFSSRSNRLFQCQGVWGFLLSGAAMAEIHTSAMEKNAFPHGHVEYAPRTDSSNEVEGLEEPEEKVRLFWMK